MLQKFMVQYWIQKEQKLLGIRYCKSEEVVAQTITSILYVRVVGTIFFQAPKLPVGFVLTLKKTAKSNDLKTTWYVCMCLEFRSWNPVKYPEFSGAFKVEEVAENIP